MACKFIDDCTYFLYDKNENVCKLHSDVVSGRICDIVHGTPEPSFQACVDNGTIPWGQSEGKSCNIIINYIGIIFMKRLKYIKAKFHVFYRRIFFDTMVYRFDFHSSW